MVSGAHIDHIAVMEDDCLLVAAGKMGEQQLRVKVRRAAEE